MKKSDNNGIQGVELIAVSNTRASGEPIVRGKKYTAGKDISVEDAGLLLRIGKVERVASKKAAAKES